MRSYAIQSSTNLMDWFGFKTTSGAIQALAVTDGSGNNPKFYRAMLLPF